jgi:C-terminal processing protease CtpA/Prc
MRPASAVGASILITALAVSCPMGAQQLDRIARERGLAMVEDVRHDIERYYYDSTYHGIDVAATFARADSGVRQANALSDVFVAIAQAVAALDDSHTFFLPPGMTVQVDYGWQMRMVGDRCLIDSVVSTSDAARQGVAPGTEVVQVNGHAPTRRNLLGLLYAYRWIRPQRGLRVLVRTDADSAPRPLDIASTVTQRRRIVDLTGADGGRDIWRLIMDEESDARRWRSEYTVYGQTFYWRLPTFEVGDDLVRDVMNRARGHATLILDLRNNGGGAESAMRALLGEWSDHDDTIGVLHQRSRNEPLVVTGRGARAFPGKVIVLIDSRSASAAEVVARTVQLGHRGIVIGDRSAGMVMRSRAHAHQQGAETQIFYSTSITDADIIMADGGRLEKIGVTPDEVVLPTAVDLRTHHDPVLARAGASQQRAAIARSRAGYRTGRAARRGRRRVGRGPRSGPCRRGRHGARRMRRARERRRRRRRTADARR